MKNPPSKEIQRLKEELQRKKETIHTLQTHLQTALDSSDTLVHYAYECLANLKSWSKYEKKENEIQQISHDISTHHKVKKDYQHLEETLKTETKQ
jgi:chromosome segregation ATPase